MLSALLPAVFVVFWIAVTVFLAALPTTTTHRGLWRVHRTDTGLVWFDSDLGRFRFPNANTFAVQLQHQPERRIPLTDVVAVRFTYQQLESREALEAVGVQLWAR